LGTYSWEGNVRVKGSAIGEALRGEKNLILPLQGEGGEGEFGKERGKRRSEIERTLQVKGGGEKKIRVFPP